MARRPGHARCRPTRAARGAASGGFTLIELLVVVAIAALVMQLVTANLGAMIPSKAMDSAARQLISRLDFIRSEAQLQGKIYRIQFDLDNHRYRTVMPPEDRLLSTEAQKEEFFLDWNSLGDDVILGGHEVAGGPLLRSGLTAVEFDPHGFTADQTIYMAHVTDESMVWSIRLRGLTGTADIARSFDGRRQPLETADEGSF